ncbi:MAG: PAS domain S-box protein [Leptospirales bacterium]|nr:PAS domain S-box protein [Leptospirales bacterium]
MPALPAFSALWLLLAALLGAAGGAAMLRALQRRRGRAASGAAGRAPLNLAAVSAVADDSALEYRRLADCLPVGLRIVDLSAIKRRLDARQLTLRSLRSADNKQLEELSLLAVELESNAAYGKALSGLQPLRQTPPLPPTELMALVLSLLQGETICHFASIAGGPSQELRFEVRAGLLRDDWSRVALCYIDQRERSQRRNLELDRAQEFRTQFESSPLPMQRLDLSEIEEYFFRLLRRGVENLLSYFYQRPRRIGVLARRIRVRASNRAMQRTFGPRTASASLLGLSEFQTDSETLRKCLGALLNLFEGELRSEAGFSMQMPNGRRFHGLMSAAVLPHRGMSDVMTTYQDISDLLNASEALVESEARARAILGAVTDAVTALSAAGEIVYANEACQRLFGFELYELLGQPAQLLLGNVDPGPMIERAGVVGEGREPERHELIGKRKDGESLLLQATIARVGARNWSGATAVMVMKDVTELTRYRMYLEEEVAQRTDQLSSALAREKELYASLEMALLKERELNVMRRNFVSVVSHEFRTPLAVIQSSADLLGQYLDRMTPEQRQSRIEKIRREVHNMATLMEDVMFFERASAKSLRLESSRVSLPEYLSEIAGDCQLASESSREIKIVMDRPQAEAAVLDIALRRALANLIVNALKYSQGPGAIEVRIGGDSRVLAIQVANDGEIDPAIRDHVFEPFVRGKAPDHPPGTGLGLAIAARAAELCGGAIRVAEFGPPRVVLEISSAIDSNATSKVAAGLNDPHRSTPDHSAGG